jgi:thiol-disulfide isomerase/thioredoxin
MRIFITQTYEYVDIKRGKFSWEYDPEMGVVDHACIAKVKGPGYFIDGEGFCPHCRKFCPPLILLAANLNVEASI